MAAAESAAHMSTTEAAAHVSTAGKASAHVRGREAMCESTRWRSACKSSPGKPSPGKPSADGVMEIHGRVVREPW